MSRRDDILCLLKLAEDSIRAAQILLAEDLPRFAVSRAYYAMFYTAQALLLTQGLEFTKHSSVVARYGQVFAKTGRLDPR